MKIVQLTNKTEIFNAFNSIKDTFPDLSNRVNIEDYLNKIAKYALVFAAYDGENIMGFAAMYANDNKAHTAYITLVGVCKAYRRMHLGTALLAKCFEYAKECGMKHIQLEVNKNNTAAIALYENNGFVRLRDSGCDREYMQRRI